MIGNHHADVEALLEEPALPSVVNALLEGHPFDRTMYRRPQVLFNLPNSHTWTVPTHWHVGDVGLEVLELTGAPGDVYFTDLRILHTAVPNAADHPRTMATHRFVRADVVQEIAEAFGWE